MKLQTNARESVMVVTIDGWAEIRFTPGGKGLATFTGKYTGRVIFQQWEDDEQLARKTPYERDSGEYEGTMAKLADLPTDATITVAGRSQVQSHTIHDGTVVRRNLFIVRDWQYDGWEWKVKNVPLGLSEKVVA